MAAMEDIVMAVMEDIIMVVMVDMAVINIAMVVVLVVVSVVVSGGVSVASVDLKIIVIITVGRIMANTNPKQTTGKKQAIRNFDKFKP